MKRFKLSMPSQGLAFCIIGALSVTAGVFLRSGHELNTGIVFWVGGVILLRLEAAHKRDQEWQQLFAEGLTALLKMEIHRRQK